MTAFQTASDRMEAADLLTYHSRLDFLEEAKKYLGLIPLVWYTGVEEWKVGKIELGRCVKPKLLHPSTHWRDSLESTDALLHQPSSEHLKNSFPVVAGTEAGTKYLDRPICPTEGPGKTISLPLIKPEGNRLWWLILARLHTWIFLC